MKDTEQVAADQGGADNWLGGTRRAKDPGALPRKWSDEEKALIVQESFERGKTVADVAEHHGVPPSRLSKWRKLARKGMLAVPPASEAEGAFAAVEVEAASAPAHVGSVSIESRGVTVRLDGDVSTARITSIASALRGIR